jgi:hypothetical protein
MHAHKCGFDPRHPEHAGCGHVWEHGEENLKKETAHVCPACGRGPWWSHHNDVAEFMLANLLSVR